MADTYDIFAGSEGNKIFGELLKSHRLSNQMRVNDVSKKICVNPSFVSGIERGVQAPSLTTAARIMKAVGMPFVTNGETDADALIQWADIDSDADLVVYHPNLESPVGFRFKAVIRGQNRRPDFNNEPVRRTRRGKSALHIRRDALDLAVASNPSFGTKTEEIITRAKAFEAYLIGEEQ